MVNFKTPEISRSNLNITINDFRVTGFGKDSEQNSNLKRERQLEDESLDIL